MVIFWQQGKEYEMSENCFVSYQGEIKDRMGAVYQRGIALKILEQMDRIRNNSNLTFARRWPQELLQNQEIR